MATDMNKATVNLEIKVEVPIADQGYLGSAASVDDHIKKAIEEVSRWRVGIKKNPVVPDYAPVEATLKVKSVILSKED